MKTILIKKAKIVNENNIFIGDVLIENEIKKKFHQASMFLKIVN